ncbi:glycosyltransferase [Flammeovirga kamogawensis]|uniref:Glycosyltransferase n=1 Tax=Flammeovirga kamogawensis TaxID=373891 RepID=A0ABX8H0H2_9BACT|nr:glycosyltransferase [Flammeovirga kamogawensis]MBB6459553.1 glycosyltransferase involved in cell wall biosynthesis [Flammeovirga kamogawensis]QWG09104.1 glycosyltransferase [Flammeovirga kamogawensis]TRX67392.1 glycosyltransferase [Flammeovirga kamogawensis]
MSNTPLVTVICLSYNHENFIDDAIGSIAKQTYYNIEIIIIDDASKDQSVGKIKSSLQKYNLTSTFLKLTDNIGNCKAFNKGLEKANGKYIIDFALDDVLLPNRVQDDVTFFESLTTDFGAIFSDAGNIDTKGNRTKDSFYNRNMNGELLFPIKSGDLYERILQNPPLFPAPTITFRGLHLKELGGYDESLAYEDYDIWIRLSRKYKVAFYDTLTTLKRDVPSSLSKHFYKVRGNALLRSTLKICIKARELNKTKKENQALNRSIKYHMRMAFFTENFYTSKGFASLLNRNNALSLIDKCIVLAARFHIPLAKLYKFYQVKR